MACTGECLWAAHPAGWAFDSGVHYYLLTPDGVGFDLKLSVNDAPLPSSDATAYPSRVEMSGEAGPVRVAGAKWITADDVLATRLTLENTSDAAVTVNALLTLPSDTVKTDGDRFSWDIERHGLKIGLLGYAQGFIQAPDEAKVVSSVPVIQGESPVAQNGSTGPDHKAAAGGGRVLGSDFGGKKGHFAEWNVPVEKEIPGAVLTFRYARASAGSGAFRVTADGRTIAERYEFKQSGGWGDAANEFALASFDLGTVPAGTVPIRIEALEDGSNVNFDELGIHARGVELPVEQTAVSHKVRSVALEPHGKATLNVYLAASTAPDKRAKALDRIVALNDPLAAQRDEYNGWLADNVPDFRSDDALTRQYWHRATSIVKKSLFRVGEGRLKHWSIAEGRWNNTWYPNAISYGAGHQIRECRWLRDPLYARDLLTTWCENERDNGIFPNFIRPDEIGNGQYTDWIASTAWDVHCVAPDLDKLREWADALKRNVDGWLKVYDPDNDGLLLVDSHWWTGMEWQPSFFYFHDFDKDKQDQKLERVDLTAYVYGDAKNLSRVLDAIGDKEGAAHYAGIADTIAKVVEKVMWDPETKFIYSVEPNEHKKAMVKEVVGVYPFYFSMFPADTPCVTAWSSLLDPEEFWTDWPVASASKKCPAYSQDITFHGKDVGGCMWNGPTWPHANSIVLSAMAATLRDFPESPLKVEDFHKLLRSFTMAQFLDQDPKYPWTGEYYNGDNAKWRTTERDYDHSTYIDILIADYAGLRPGPEDLLELRPLLTPDSPAFVLDGIRYHGHDITIAWNPRSNAGSPDGLIGYRVYIDGHLRHHTGTAPSKAAMLLK
jgi:hypothetical protein